MNFCLLSGSFLLRQSLIKSDKEVSHVSELYYGELIEEPVIKQRSVTCRLALSDGRKIIAYISVDSAAILLRAGDCIYFRSILEKPKNNAGKNAFDYASYLRKQGYSAITYIRKSDWKIYSRQFGLKYTALECRRILLEKMKKLSLDEKAYQVGVAMLLGYKNALDPDLSTSFAVSGTSHLLSVSGLHVTTLYGAIYFIFSVFFRNRKYKIYIHLIVLPIIWGFAFVTGLSPSVVRAVTMFSIAGVGSVLNKKSITLNTLSGTAFIMLLYEPLYLFDVSFQLSFVAVASIVCIYPVFKNLYQNRNKVVSYAGDLFFISFSAQVGTSPISIFYFHQFPVYFWLSNMLVIPLTGVLLMLLSFCLILQSVFSLPGYFFKPLNLSYRFFISIVEIVEKFPYSSLQNIYLDEIQVFLIYGIILLLLLWFNNKKTIYLYLIQIFVLIQLICYF